MEPPMTIARRSLDFAAIFIRPAFHSALCSVWILCVKAMDLAVHRNRRSNVRFGSKADIEAPPTDVRFTPKADMVQHDRDVRFVPKADISQLPTGRSSPPRIPYTVWYSAIAITARVSVLLGCRSSSRIVK
jgi:hypothetical protein